MQHATTVGVRTLELSLVFGISEVGVYVFAEDIFSRPVFGPPSVRELLVAITEAAYWVGWHVRVQMSRFDLYNVVAVGLIRLFLDKLAIVACCALLKVVRVPLSFRSGRGSVAFEFEPSCRSSSMSSIFCP